jgi:hypothetical protein
VQTDDARRLVQTNSDFVYAKRFNNSLAAVRARYPEGAPDHVVAAALMITEDDVDRLYDEAVVMMQKHLQVT